MSRHLETVKSGGGGGCMPQDTCRACAQKRRVQKYAPVPPLYVFLLCVRGLRPDGASRRWLGDKYIQNSKTFRG